MKHSPFQKTFKLFWILTAVTIAVRFWLQFTQIDHTSGFYNATALGRGCQLGFNALLAVCALLIWLSVRRHGKDFSAERKPFGREFFIGLIVMGFTAELSYLYTFLTEFSDLFHGHGLYLPSALPAIIFVVGGILLLYQGLLGISGKQENIDLLSASILSLWGAAALVCTYLGYTVVYHVSDNMLHILAIASMAFFLTMCLKYMMGVDPEVSGRRAMHYGLFTGYFSLALVVPRLVVLAVYGGQESLPAPKFYSLIFVLVVAAVALIACYTIALPVRPGQGAGLLVFLPRAKAAAAQPDAAAQPAPEEPSPAAPEEPAPAQEPAEEKPAQQ